MVEPGMKPWTRGDSGIMVVGLDMASCPDHQLIEKTAVK